VSTREPGEGGRGETSPAAPGRPRRHRRAVRAGTEQPASDEKAWDEDDRAWGDAPEDREERLRRDVPPHWG
jgi:hypothetical protein